MRPRLGSERGSATVELALAAPVLLLVLVSLVDLGRVANTYAMVRAASVEGARYAIVHQTADTGAIATYVRGRAALVDGARLEVTATFYDGAHWQPWRPTPFASPYPSTMPVRIEYGLTEKGRGLQEAIEALGRWAEHWDEGDLPVCDAEGHEPRCGADDD